MNLARWTMARELETRVLHRLPGRLRLAIPALVRVPRESRDQVRELLDEATLPQGVASVEPSFLAGTLLVRYDPGAITEERVLSWVDDLVDGARTTAARLLALPEERRGEESRRLEQTVRDACRRGALVDRRVMDPGYGVDHVRGS